MNLEWRDYLFDRPDEPWEEAVSLWEMIERNPRQPWDFWLLSQHPELPWDFLERHIHRSWDWQTLSAHENLDFEVIHRNSEKDWNWRMVSEHPNVTLETICKYPNHFWNFTKRKVPWSILKLCPVGQLRIQRDSPSVDLNIVIEDPTLAWDWTALSRRRDVTPQFVDEHPDFPWDWKVLGERRNFPMEIVGKYPEKSWNWEALSHKIMMDWSRVEINIDKPWNFQELATRNDLPLRLVFDYPEKWDLQKVFSHQQNWELVMRCPRRPWNWKRLTKTVPWKYVEERWDLPWDWKMLSSRKQIPWKFLVTHVHLPWVWHKISLNEEVTEAFVMRHSWYPWNRWILKKRFGYDIIALLCIQRWWLRLYYMPTSAVCIRRLLRDCAELNKLCENKSPEMENDIMEMSHKPETFDQKLIQFDK